MSNREDKIEADHGLATTRGRWLKCFLIAYVVVAFYFQHQMGLADNGDFSRASGGFTTGPSGINLDNAPPGSPVWKQRYGSYWLPYWELELSRARIGSSSVLLWMPGVALNHVFFSGRTLYAPALSLVPKALLVLVMLLLFRWIDRGAARNRLLSYLVLVGPIALLLSCPDYLAFLSTFYQESGSYVFALLFVAGILLLDQDRQSKAYFALSLLSAIGLACAKQSTAFTPILTIPVLLHCGTPGGTWGATLRRYVRIGIPLTACIVALAVITTRSPGAAKTNQFNSLFHGLLLLSDDPQQRLTDLGLQDAGDCLGKTAFVPEAARFIELHPDKLAYSNTLRVLWKEPAVFFRTMDYVARNMQDVSLEYLGRFAEVDPRAKEQAPAVRDCESRSQTPPPWSVRDLWANVKFRYFPTGIAFYVCCLVYAITFALGLRLTGHVHGLSCVGLFATAASVIDMLVAILGDGRSELVKHLFLANVLFDVATIAWLSVVIGMAPKIRGRRLSVRSTTLDTP